MESKLEEIRNEASNFQKQKHKFQVEIDSILVQITEKKTTR